VVVDDMEVGDGALLLLNVSPNVVCSSLQGRVRIKPHSAKVFT